MKADAVLQAVLTACADGNRIPVPWARKRPSSWDLPEALRFVIAQNLALTSILARPDPQAAHIGTELWPGWQCPSAVADVTGAGIFFSSLASRRSVGRPTIQFA